MTNTSKNLVFLYAEICPYHVVVFDSLIKMGYSVHAFEQKNRKLTPYQIEDKSELYISDASNIKKEDLLESVRLLNPLIIVVVGWSFKKYLYVARSFRKNTNIPVVCIIDTQYLGTIRQRIGFMISPIYIKPYFSHFWVPGVRQYYFAKRLGYSNDKIILYSLSGNYDLFARVSIEEKQNNYPKKFLYVGRYSKEKGLNVLIDAWKQIDNKNGWTISLVGNGPLKNKLDNIDGVEVLDYLAQSDLVKIAQQSGCFILPSVYEPWALVLHEFAAAGLPIICTYACGAAPHFVISGYNGFTIESNNVAALRKAMERIIFMSEKDLVRMSYNSREISKYVTPERSARALLSILE